MTMRIFLLFVFVISVIGAKVETYQKINCLSDPIGICSGHGICISNTTHIFGCKCDKNWDDQGCDTTQCCNELYPRIKIFYCCVIV